MIIASIIRFSWVGILLAAPIHLVGEPTVTLVDPPALYLTWLEDPATTQTIIWHHEWREGHRDPVLHFRQQGEDSSGWRIVEGGWAPAPFMERLIHTVTLRSLQPGATYEFQIGTLLAEGSESFSFKPLSRVYHFRALDILKDDGIRFVVGGDVYGNRDVYETINRQIAHWGPDFAVIGGDIAYANGNPARADRWKVFFDVWRETMERKDGTLIPLLAAIGNHEAHGDDYDLRGGAPGRGVHPFRAPFLSAFFPMPGETGYGALDFGDQLTLLLMDSFHANPVGGQQSEWLRQTLSERKGRVRDVVPIYHVPAYPSVRAFSGGVSAAIREHWLPLFEDAGVRVAFEHHDHAYKRTHPIRDGKLDARGITFLGDGAWSVGLRNPASVYDPEKGWYLAVTESRHHVFLVTLSSDRIVAKAMDPDGIIFDEAVIKRSE